MTKLEQLTSTAAGLTEDQLDGLLDFALYLTSEPVYVSASDEVLQSIARGIEDVQAGRTTTAEDVYAELQRKLDAYSAKPLT